MIIKGNILNIEENIHNYNLIDIKKRKFPTYYDGDNTHILNYQNSNLNMNNIFEKVAIHLDFYQEMPSEISNIIKNYRKY